MANSVASIEKLNSENYGTWCIQVKSLLITLDLWNTIEIECPIGAAEKTIWMNNDRKALATITLSVKASELIHIKNCATAKEAWDVLSSLYKADTASRKVKLFKKLVRFKFRHAEKFSVQINEFCCTIDELKEIGISLNDDLLTILLLCSLPDEMEGFVIAIESRDKLPTYDKLISKILEEETRQGDKTVDNGETAFAANSKSGNKSHNKDQIYGHNLKNEMHSQQSKTNFNNKKSPTSNMKCFRCGKIGHIRSQCKNGDSEKRRRDYACSLYDNRPKIATSWIMDSGATSHMCRNKLFFQSLTESRQQIILASGESIFAEGIGDIKLQTSTTTLTLRNVWYVPQLHSNFLSISKIIKAGHSVVFHDNGAVMKSTHGVNILMAELVDEMFIAKVRMENEVQSLNVAVDKDVTQKWHKRFGHMNVHDMCKLVSKNMVNGLVLKVPDSIDCVTCGLCKISAKPFKAYSTIQTKDVLELLHMDICGPMDVQSIGGSSYFMTIIDDFSRFTFVFCLKKKSEAFEVFERFAATVEKQTDRQIKVVRSDNGKEFINIKFQNFFARKGIVHQTTVCYTPQQNGVDFSGDG